MSDEICVDPEKLWQLAVKISPESTNLATATSGISSAVNGLPDIARNRVIYYVPSDSIIEACCVAISNLAAYLQDKALAFGYIDNAEYWVGRRPYDGGPTEYGTGTSSLGALQFLLDYMVDPGISIAKGAGIYLATEAIKQRVLLGELSEEAGEAALKNVGRTGALSWAGRAGLGVTIAVEGINLINRVGDDWDRYDGTEFGVAFGIDVLESAAVVAASEGGMYLGAAIGTAICPGVGTVIGGIVGSMVASWAADYLVSEFDDSELKEDIVEGTAAGLETVAGATVDAVGWVGNTVGDFCDSLW